MFNNIRQKIIRWCLQIRTVQIGDLHISSNPRSCEIFNNDELKFVEQTSPHILVETPTGFSSVKHTFKTIKYQTRKIQTTNHTLMCADEHILIDENDTEVFVKDLKIGNKIKTKNGIEHVTQIETPNSTEHMYDIELDDNNHVYYTNGMLSHNSECAAAFILWYGMFNFNKTVLIASRANDHAMEMIQRIRFAYEQLPFWLKPGVNEDGWNKHTIGFDNGSRIMSTATSANAGRGFSISLLYLDEFAFVPSNIQDEFWTSIQPTLSTGGSCIMTSTPNGDMDIYAEVWRGANLPGNNPKSKCGHNGYRPIRVHWNQPPGRDDTFKEEQIAKLGERKWMQEYECCAGSTLVDIQDEFGNEKTIKISDLYEKMRYDLPLV